MMKVSTLIIGFLFLIEIFGQDPVFNQTDNSRNYLNPAYIGTEKSFSADLNYRNQWPELSGNFKTLAVQMNQYLGKGNGMSMHFVNDNAANTLIKTELGLGYAKQFKFADKHKISIGTQVSYFTKKLNWDKLTFGNMIDPRRGFVYDSVESRRGGGPIGLDFNLGVLYYSRNFFVGYSAKHITEPNESFDGSISKLPLRHIIEVGGKVYWREIAFIPALRLFQQGTFQTMFATLKVKFAFLEVDAGIQNKNAFFGGVGFHSEHLNVGYNYTRFKSGFGFNASTHEIRMGCNFDFLNKTNELYFDF